MKDKATPQEILDQTIYGVWNTSTLKDLITYIIQGNINFAGFDIKPSAMQNKFYYEKNILSASDTAIANLALSCSKRFTDIYRSHGQSNNKQHLDKLLSDLHLLNSLMNIKHFTISDSLTLKIYKQEIKNRMYLIRELTKKDFSKITASRDSLMAKTIEWLTKEIYPNKKIIFWGHNEHISKNNRKNGVSMCALLPRSILNESYVIGLYMFRGETYINEIIEVRKPFKNSLEAIMIQPGYKYSFIDFSKVENSEYSSWIFKQIPSLLWGRFKRNVILKKTYDGIIFIDNASLPDHYIIDYKTKLK